MERGNNRLWARLLESPPTVKKTYILTTAAGGMSAMTMLTLQLLTSRILGAEAAGRVSVDAATVLLCFQLGQLNMRPYQCTDLGERFSFPEYLTLKTITVALMSAICLVYVLARGYDAQRSLFCLAFCAFKALEALSDCFWGMLQQRGRLDLAALGGAVYHAAAIAAFAATLIAYGKIGAAALTMALTGGLVFFLYTMPVGGRVEAPRLCGHGKQLARLAGILLPLFAAGYFLNLAITLPKYALEIYGDEAAQGYFAALSMTAQGVLLLSAFLYYPQLTALARHASEGDKAGFLRLMRKLWAAIILLDLALAAGGWLVGAQLLGWLFDLPLSPYRVYLLLILIGGGFFSLYTVTSYALIAMRAQKGLALLTLAALALTAALNSLLVPRLGLCGAALS